MAEDPVIPKLEDLKRAFIESNRVEAERNEKNENKRSQDLKDKIADLSKETPKNIKKDNELIQTLMGNDVGSRKDFIIDNAIYASDLDI